MGHINCAATLESLLRARLYTVGGVRGGGLVHALHAYLILYVVQMPYVHGHAGRAGLSAALYLLFLQLFNLLAGI